VGLREVGAEIAEGIKNPLNFKTQFVG